MFCSGCEALSSAALHFCARDRSFLFTCFQAGCVCCSSCCSPDGSALPPAAACLRSEPLDEPPRLLQQVLAQQQLDASEFVTLRHGALLQTAGGVDLNSPPLLPLSE